MVNQIVSIGGLIACGMVLAPGRFLTKLSNDSYDCMVSGSIERRYAWKTMSSKYRLRFCKPGGSIDHSGKPKPSLATVRTLVSEGLLLSVIRSLFTPSTSFFD